MRNRTIEAMAEWREDLEAEAKRLHNDPLAITASEYARMTGMTENTARKVLRQRVADGTVRLSQRNVKGRPAEAFRLVKAKGKAVKPCR